MKPDFLFVTSAHIKKSCRTYMQKSTGKYSDLFNNSRIESAVFLNKFIHLKYFHIYPSFLFWENQFLFHSKLKNAFAEIR